MKHELISEKTIIINYCLALNQPNFSASLPEEDWISSISMLNLKDSVNFLKLVSRKLNRFYIIIY